MKHFTYTTLLTSGPHAGKVFGVAAEDNTDFFEECVDDPEIYIDEKTLFAICSTCNDGYETWINEQEIYETMRAKHSKYLKEGGVNNREYLSEWDVIRQEREDRQYEIDRELGLTDDDMVGEEGYDPDMSDHGMSYTRCPSCGSNDAIDYGDFKICSNCEKRWI